MCLFRACVGKYEFTSQEAQRQSDRYLSTGNAFDEFIGNKCIQDDGEFYTFGNQNCTDKTQVPFTAANTFYSKGANFSCNGASLEAMQAAGLDIGTTVHDVPTIAEIIAMGKAALA